MKGTIEAISFKEKKVGIKVNGAWYSTWKDKWPGGYSRGDTIDFEFVVNGDFKNITKVNPKSQDSEENGSTLNKRSCLHASVLSFQGKDVETLDIITRADDFYNWVIEKEKPEEDVPF